MQFSSTSMIKKYAVDSDLMLDKHPSEGELFDELQNGLSFTTVTVDGALANDRRVVANKGTLLTLTLPTTAAVGQEIEIMGLGAGGWKVAQNANQLIHKSGTASTTGTGGHLDSANRYDGVRLVCVVANTEWSVVIAQGSITIT
jgi:hypothetical protein